MRLLGLFLACALLPVSAVGAESSTPTLPEVMERFEKLQISGAGGLSAKTHLVSGHLDCTLTGGSVALVKAGDDVVGVFFSGTGSMEYVSEDPIEAPVMTFMAKKDTHLSPEKTSKGILLKDNFSTLLWISVGESLPDIPRVGSASLDALFQAHREKFLHKRGERLSMPFAVQRLNAPKTAMVWVEMAGGSEDLLYRRHDGLNAAESLAYIHSSSSGEAAFKDALYAVTLSRQLGRDRKDPPQPGFVLTDVDLDLKASDDKDVTMTVVETLVPQKQPRSVFPFDLDSTVYATFGAHLTNRTERVKRVTDEAGRSLPYWHQNGSLLVQVAEPALPDRPVKLRFEIDGDFLVHPGGSSYWELGIWSWFPQPELYEQRYTFHAVVRVKKPYVPFAPGTTVRRAVEGDDNLLETKVENPIQFAVVLAGDYTYKEEVRNGVTIRVATYALKNDRAIKQLTGLAAGIIDFYKDFLGPFPFSEFNILEIDDYGFGQAPPGIMFITKEAFNPLGGNDVSLDGVASQPENQIYSRGINERFAHEIAHQYWGYVVSPPDDDEEWLAESFAEYCAALFMKAGKGDGEYKMIVSHWKGETRFAIDKAPIPLANRVYVANDFRSQFFIRVGLLYNKGPLLLYALHKELGDQTFLTFLKSYQKSFRWKYGSTKTVAGLLQALTKKDYMPFFEAN
ncbi:MAG TPA: M1 family aminopeptidase, partial [Thermoanaerobaculia bacterium]|nr:M1 family aminopeptidase [Thermoanaerobaculia bacterium]